MVEIEELLASETSKATEIDNTDVLPAGLRAHRRPGTLRHERSGQRQTST